MYPMIRIMNVGFRYVRKAPWVFRSLRLEIPPGLVCLPGPSGCGKSTLLKLVAGFLNPLEGEIRLPGIGRPAQGSYQRCHLGYVFQSLNLLPLASLRRNCLLAASIAGMSDTDANKRIEYLLGELGLAAFEACRPAGLSGGQQQRAALVRALAREPKFLLLDEPTSQLDNPNAQSTIEVLRCFLRADPDRFCLIATHDIRLLDVADYVVELHHHPLPDP